MGNAYLPGFRPCATDYGQLLNVRKLWGVIQKLTTACHPQTNSTERTNQTLKTMTLFLSTTTVSGIDGYQSSGMP